MSSTNLVQTNLNQFFSHQQVSVQPSMHPMLEEQFRLVSKIKEQIQLIQDELARQLFTNFLAALEQTWKVIEFVERSKTNEIQQINEKIKQVEATQLKHGEEIQDLYENIGMITRENQDEQEEEQGNSRHAEEPDQQIQSEIERRSEIIPIIAEKLQMSRQEIQQNLDRTNTRREYHQMYLKGKLIMNILNGQH